MTVTNALGLHARAAAQLVRKAGEYSSRLTLTLADGSGHADAKSILSVLALAACMGTELIIRAEGPDEDNALAGLTELFRKGFGEV